MSRKPVIHDYDDGRRMPCGTKRGTCPVPRGEVCAACLRDIEGAGRRLERGDPVPMRGDPRQGVMV